MYAELHASIRNIPLNIGFKPIQGKFWTAAMFLPDFKESSVPDWEKDKEALMRPMREIQRMKKMAAIGGQSREQRQESARLAKIFSERRATIARMKEEGASKEAIRAVMSEGV